MAVPFLSSISLNKNEVQDFKVFNYAGDVTPLTGTDIGYFWTNTTGGKTLRWWDGTAVRTILDSASTTIVAADLSGGAAGSLPYQQGANDTTFLGIGTAGQVLSVSSGVPAWVNQSSLSVGSATTATTATTADKVANALTAGTYLTAGGTFDGSTARTFAVDATSANTASKVVARDASGNFSAGVITATNVTGLSSTPANDADAASKGYVDSVAQGLDVKASCLVATTADITLSAPGAVTIDGVYSATDFTAGTTRILVKSQSLSQENGIYIWQGPSSAMTRSVDANTWDELVGAFTFVERGTDNADSGWVCNVNAGGTLGTTAVTWTKFSQAGSYTAGNGMVLSGGVFHFAQSSAYTAGQIPFCSNSPTANSIGFSSNLFWDNGNNRLGIGTASPTSGTKLDIVSTTSNHFVRFTDSNATGYLGITSGGSAYLHGNNNYVSLSCSTSNTTPTEQFRITNPGVFEFFDGVGGMRMKIDSSGNLGLGAVSPSQRLFVQSASSPIAAFNSTSVSGPYLIFQSSGTSFGDIGSAKAITGSYNATDMALNARSAASMYFCISDVAKMVLDANGRLGIGTATPSAKLEVNDANGIPIRLGDIAAPPASQTAVYVGASTSALSGANGDLVLVPRTSDPRSILFYTGSGTASLKATLSSDGNLGLGVTPASTVRLDVAQTSRISFFVNGADTEMRSTNLAGSAFAKSTFNATSFDWGLSNSFGKMTLDASGNLGVGIAPAARLVSAGSSSTVFKGLILRNADGTTGSSATIDFETSSGTHGDEAAMAGRISGIRTGAGTSGAIAFSTTSGGTLGERLRISSTGQALFSTNGTASAPTIANADNPDTGLYWPTDADTLALAVGGSDAIYIDSSRNVRIGGAAAVGVLTVTNSTTNTSIGLVNLSGFANTNTNSIDFYLDNSNSGVVTHGVIGCINTAATANRYGELFFKTANAAAPVTRIRIKAQGQLNLVPISADPAGPEAGDVYYNSTSNTLKWYGTAWNTLPRKVSAVGVGTGPSITVTHNFGTKDVIVQVRNSSDAQVLTDVSYATNSVTVTFADSNTTLSNYTVTVIG